MRIKNFSRKIKIRRGMESDSEALGELIELFEAEGNKYTAIKDKEEEWIYNKIKDDFIHNLKNPGKWLFFAFDGEKLIGYVDGMVLDSVPLGEKQHMERMKGKYGLVDEKVGLLGIVVHKDYSQKEIGKILMKKAIQEAKEFGVTVLIVNINNDNISGISFHKKLGFKEHKKLKKGEIINGKVITKENIIMKLDL